MSVSTNLPVAALLEELSKSKNEKILNFYNWLKDTCDESINTIPKITCVNYDHPELVAFGCYTTKDLEKDGLEEDEWIEYRQNTEGSLVPFHDEDLADDAQDLIKQSYR